AGNEVDPAIAQLTHQEVIVEQRVGQNHVTRLESVIHSSQESGFTSPLALVWRDGQIVTGAGGQRQQHCDPSERKAKPRLLHRRLWVARLILGRVRHGNVRTVGDVYRSPVPLPLLGDAALLLLSCSLPPSAEDRP